MRDPDALLKYLPLFSIGVVLVCIFYVNGYFSYPGKYWVTSLSISDYISLCAPVLPALLLGVLVGVVSWDDPIFAKMERDLKIQEWINAKPEPSSSYSSPQTEPSKPKRRVEYIAFAGAFLVYLAYSFARDFLPIQFVWWSLGLAVLASIVLGIWFLVFSLFRDWVLGLAALVAFAVGAVSYSYGQVQGAIALTARRNTIVELSGDRRLCASVLVLMNKGPLISTDGRAAQLINWSEVRSMTRHPGCREVEEE
jgi:hypothetical protein